MAEGVVTMQQKLLQRWGALKTERAIWWAHWEEISRYLLPRSGRYFRQDRNRGNKRNNSIYDSTATSALKTLAAGLMSGATSPARPWFRLATPDPELNAYQPVKLWLNDVTNRMLRVFHKSNTYDALALMYAELGAFGTAANIIVPDFDTVIHNHTRTIGEYAIESDFKGRVCTIYSEFEKTTGELVKEFGKANCSTRVQDLYDRGQLDTWIPVIHAIEPRADRDPRKRDAKNMAWASWYFELGSGNEGKVLRESGFKRFPAVCPRWSVQGGDVYGNSPGMDALGDIKQLQHEQLKKATAIDYKVDPPLQVPTWMKGRDFSRMPGGVSYYEPTTSQAPVKSLYDVNLSLNELLQDIQDVRQRISKVFFEDLFLMMVNSDPRMTATEVAVRKEEKMAALGPVLDRLNTELLYPLIETTFLHMVEAGAVPPPPEDLQHTELSVEFVSMLAQAQQAIGTNSVDRFVGNLGTIAQMKPDVLDKFDADAWVDSYSDMLGVDPNLIIASDKVAVVRQARAKAQAAQAQAAAMQQQSQAAKNLAQAPTGGAPNALMDVLNQYSGYGSPSPVEA